ncbi:MAG TPA: TIGR04219 family outer membrane beta-barrel protein [Arcobacter sp.]|nr:TIGR04219 family outer membrane beta-barrel protein [Arcobacter sp.]
MKKIILSTVAAMALTTSVYAEISLEIGAGIWKPSLSGDVNYKGSTINFDSLGVKDELEVSNNYLYADFKHFVPIIPNIMVQQLNYGISGNSSLNTNITFDNQTFNVGETVKTTIDMKQTDFIMYWGLPFINTLSAGVFDINYGLDAKNISGSIQINEKSKSFDEVLPLLYLNAKISIPVIDTDIVGTIKTLSYDGAKISDNEIKASIKLPISSLLVDVKVDAGYKVQNITIPSSLVDNFDAKIDTDGFFFGLSAKF